MQLKSGWTLTELSGEYVAVPTDESAENFSGIVRLNETGKDIWDGLVESLSVDDIAERLLNKYSGVDFDRAKKAVLSVIDTLKKEGILEQ